MRFLLPAAAIFALLAQPATGQRPALVDPAKCPNAASHMAHDGGSWRGKPIAPRKLAELPPADTYAAVYALDERGCAVPLLYREVRARRH